MNKKKFRVTVEVFYSFDSSYGMMDLYVIALDKDDAELKAVNYVDITYGYNISDVVSVEEVTS